MLKKLCLVFFVLGLAVNAGFAQEYVLEQVTVTATRTEKSLKDVSSTVSIITREDIEASNARSCTDILNSLPGVFVNKTGDFGRADVDIRGLGERGRKIMVLIDGRPVKMGLYGCTVTQSLPLDNVERIEVVRGPNSVLYGSDALGGVINIITRKARKEFEGSIILSGGTYNTAHYQLHLGGVRDKLDYYITADRNVTDGHLPNSSFNGSNYTGRFGFGIKENLRSILTIKYFDGIKREPLRSTDPPTPVATTWNDYKRGAIDQSFDGQWGKWNNSLKVYHNFGKHEFSDGWNSTDFTNGLMLHGTAGLRPGNELILGLEYRLQGGEVLAGGPNLGTFHKYETALFLHDEQLFFDKLIVALGARYNQDEIAGSLVSPQLGLVYHATDSLTLRAVANRGFRTPQINELYLFPPSNTDLKAETVDNYELGFNQEFLPGIDLDLVVFNLKGENLIEIVSRKFQNTGNFNFTGAELALNLNPTKNLLSRLSYGILDPGTKTTGRPGKKVDLHLRLSGEKVSVSTTAQYVTDYYAADNKQDPIPAFVVMNSKVNYKTPYGVQLFAAIDNLLDTDYVVYADLPSGAAGTYAMPGRTITGGLNYRF